MCYSDMGVGLQCSEEKHRTGHICILVLQQSIFIQLDFKKMCSSSLTANSDFNFLYTSGLHVDSGKVDSRKGKRMQ